MAESVVLNLELKIAQLERKLAAAERRMSRTEKRFKAIGSQIKGHLAGMFAVGAVSAFAQAQVDLIKRIDQSNRALKAITGTTLEYERAKSMLRVSAEKFGVNVLDLTKSYVRFYAASKSSTLATKELDTIFNRITKSAAVLGLSADEVHGVLKALEQMLSKGKVQAEELRGQLGDRLPGAFVIMAKSMGITTGELDKMLKKGGVLADEVLPKFAAEYEKAVGADALNKIKTLIGAFERFDTAWINLIESVEDGDGFFSNAFKGVVGGFTDILVGLTGVNDGIVTMAQFMGALSSGNIAVLATQISSVNDAMSIEKQKQVDAYNKNIQDLIDFQLGGISTTEDLDLATRSLGDGFMIAKRDGTELWVTMDQWTAIQKNLTEATKNQNSALEDQLKWERELNREYASRVSNSVSFGLGSVSDDPTAEIDQIAFAQSLFPDFTTFVDAGVFETFDQAADAYFDHYAEKMEELKEEIAPIAKDVGDSLEVVWRDVFRGPIEAGLTAAWDSIEMALAGQKVAAKKIFGDFFNALGESMQQIGLGMIAFGTAWALFTSGSAEMNPGKMIAAGAGMLAAGTLLQAAFGGFNARVQGGGSSRGEGRGDNNGRFMGTQTSQSIQFEPIMLKLQGKDLVGAIRANDRDVSL